MSNIIHLLLHFYPRAWRERYEEEFLALLDQYQPSLSDLPDLFLCAIEERFVSFLKGERFSMQRNSRYQALFRVVMLVAILLAVVLTGYGLLLIRTQLDSLTLVGAALISGLLVLYGLACVSIPRDRAQPGLWYGIGCGLIFGVMYSMYLAFTNLAPTNAFLNTLLTAVLLSSMCILWIAAGLLATWHTGSLSAGVRAAVWTGLIGALMAVISMHSINYAFMDIVNQNTLIYSDYIRSGVKDVTVFNIQDTLGGCFYTLLLAPIFGAIIGSVGAVVGKGRTVIFL